MVKLTKALIKKYGISKKAWSMAKKGKGKVKAKASSRGKKTMAKRKKYTKKAAPKSWTQKLMGKIGTPLAAMAYGYTREKVSNAIALSAIGQKLPVTQFTDEAVMLGLAFGARKLGFAKNAVGGKLIRSMEVVEWARIGETFSDMQGSKSTGNSVAYIQ